MSDIAVKVFFFGEIRSFVKRRCVEVTLEDGCTVGSLLDHLSDTLGDAFSGYALDPQGGLQNNVSLFVDGRSIKETEGLQTRLKTGGEVDVMIVPVYDGG